MSTSADHAPDEPAFGEAFRSELRTLMAWRRDVRRFRRDALPDGAVEQLLEAAALAPSVGNAQPWRFVRIASPGIRARLVEHVEAENRRCARAYAPDRADAYRALKLHGLREAPVVLGVFCDEATEAGHGLGIRTMPETLRYSTVMAVHTLWLAARAQEIGVGWVSILDPQAVTVLLRLPEHWSLVAILCLGYPERAALQPELEKVGWQARLPVVPLVR